MTDARLAAEMAAVAEREDQEWHERTEERRRARLDAEAEAAGTAVDCQCCFVEHSPETMACCEKGHQFCVGCIRRCAARRTGIKPPRWVEGLRGARREQTPLLAYGLCVHRHLTSKHTDLDFRAGRRRGSGPTTTGAGALSCAARRGGGFFPTRAAG